MNILDSGLYINDIRKATKRYDFSALYGKSVLITGVTGLIGSAVADMLTVLNRAGAGIKIIGAGRDTGKIQERFNGSSGAQPGDALEATLGDAREAVPETARTYYKKRVTPLQYEAMEKPKLPDGIDYIIHAAGNASPELYTAQPAETMLANITGTANLLDYCWHHGSRMVYVSSSEVYGKRIRTNESTNPDKDLQQTSTNSGKDLQEASAISGKAESVKPDASAPYRENEYGFVDQDDIRNSYAEAKRAAEMLCRAYAAEKNVSVSMIRPGHIFGPTASEKDRRVSSDFAFRAAKGEDIILLSPGLQKRSYCYCVDAACAILVCLLHGKPGEAYNIGTEEETSIREMAAVLAKAGNVKLTAADPSEAEKAAFNPMENAVLDSAKIKKIGFNRVFSAKEGLEHTVDILRELI